MITFRILVKGVLALIFMALVSVPISVQAQGCNPVSVSTSTSTTYRGDGGIGVYAMVVNCSSSKQRITVTLTGVSACGVETSLGYNRLALLPGQGILVTTAYNLSLNDCIGTYTVTATVTSGKAALGTSSTTFTVL